MLDEACLSRPQAEARGTGRLEVGQWADLLALDGNHTNLCALQRDQICDSFIFIKDRTVIRYVWSAEQHLVKDGQHIRREKIIANYRVAVAQLRDVI